MILFDHSAYLFPSIQMLKSLTPMATLLASIFLRLERFTKALLFIVSLMTLGVFISSMGEVRFDMLGVILQLLGIVSESLRLVVTQSLLQNVLPSNASPLVSISLFAPCCFLLLFPIALWFEPNAFPSLLTDGTWLLVALNTIIAFSLNIAVVMLVTRTSGLTLTLSGTIKDVLLITSSAIVFSTRISLLQVIGYTLSLASLCIFQEYKKRSDGSVIQLLKATIQSPSIVGVIIGTLSLFCVSDTFESYFLIGTGEQSPNSS